MCKFPEQEEGLGRARLSNNIKAANVNGQKQSKGSAELPPTRSDCTGSRACGATGPGSAGASVVLRKLSHDPAPDTGPWTALANAWMSRCAFSDWDVFASPFYNGQAQKAPGSSSRPSRLL